MKAFWWFKENSIAGMARPGFNQVQWMDLEFDEAALLSWLGQHSAGPVAVESLRHHLRTYCPKIFRFHRLDEISGPRAIQIFNQPNGLRAVFERLNGKTKILGGFEVAGDSVHFELNAERVRFETDFLKSRGITRVVALTEIHHNADLLAPHFHLHHIGIQDLGAPQLEQVRILAEILTESLGRKETVAVHCLAGIGRTSTMLMAAHLLLGEKLEHLKARLAKQNPSFILSGTQAEFIEKLTSA